MTEAQKKANAKYLAKLEEIKIRVPEGSKAKYKKLAEASGESLNALIVRLLETEYEWKESIRAAEEERKQEDIATLELSVRTYSQLKRMQVNTIGDLIDYWEQIKPNLGKIAQREISEKLDI